jgi:hypothetical protein
MHEQIAETGVEADEVGEVDVSPVLEINFHQGIEPRPRRALPIRYIILFWQTLVNQLFKCVAAIVGEARSELGLEPIIVIGHVILDKKPCSKLVAVLREDKATDARQKLDNEAHCEGAGFRGDLGTRARRS